MEDKKMTFNDYFYQKCIDSNIKLGTYKDMLTTHNLLNKFKVVEFSGISTKFLVSFTAFLRPRSDNTIAKIHRHVRKVVKIALRERLLTVNPYDGFTPPKTSSTRKFLTKAEFDLIVSKGGFFSDLFAFQGLTGMHVGDVMSFGKDKIDTIVVDGIEHKVIRGQRQKTNEYYTIPLLPKAEEIAIRYNYSFVFKLNDYNVWLRSSASELGITKKVTSAVARHTFATQMIEAGLPLETVSEMLGHASTKTTQIYAKITGAKVIRDMNKFYKL